MVNIAKLLTEHIDIWTAADTEKKSGRGRASSNAGSVYGVKKLRELILELAVGGKLVPQDLLGNTENRKYSKLADIVEVLDSLRKPVTKQDRVEGPYPYYGASGIVDYVSNYIFDESLVLVGEDGAKWGAGESTAFMIEGKTWVNNHAHVIRPNREIVTDKYLTYCLVSMDLNEFITGMTVPKLNQARLVSIKIPLPPLAEQHRIVAKVDELMALCDQLEQQHSNAQEAHETLVSQLLATLTQSQNVAEFNANWQRIYAHFDVLFTTEASIDALKQTLLQLAIMGKLVPQDPNDEPASELLKRIYSEKAKQIAGGKLKKEKTFTEISEEEVPFELPNGSEWVRIDFLNPDFQNGVSSRGDVGGEPIVVLRLADINDRRISLDDPRELAISAGIIDKYGLMTGDILIVRVNGSADLVGGFVLSENEINAIYCDHFIRMRISQDVLNPRFLSLVGASSLVRDRIKEMFITTAGQKTVNQNHISSLVIPLIPLAEQHRIVAKVDTLMTLCDQLKTRIQQANRQQQAIANALVAQAVQPTAEIINLADCRAATACYAIKKMQGKSYFGRTAAVKILYLAEAHLGLPLSFQPIREAAGPLDKWIYAFERQGEHEGWFKVVEPDTSNNKTKVEYQVKSAIEKKSVLIEKICSVDQLKEFDRLLGLFAVKTTEEAEIIATLFAAWNDFLIDGHTPSDDDIVKEVRENWHETKARFSPVQLKNSLEWMRSNHLVPQGRLPRTAYQQSLIKR